LRFVAEADGRLRDAGRLHFPAGSRRVGVSPCRVHQSVDSLMAKPGKIRDETAGFIGELWQTFFERTPNCLQENLASNPESANKREVEPV
jgi:hypothetical protein